MLLVRIVGYVDVNQRILVQIRGHDTQALAVFNQTDLLLPAASDPSPLLM